MSNEPLDPVARLRQYEFETMKMFLLEGELLLAIEKERVEQERIQQERIQQERIQQERIQQERLEQEQLENEREDRKVKIANDKRKIIDEMRLAGNIFFLKAKYYCLLEKKKNQHFYLQEKLWLRRERRLGTLATQRHPKPPSFGSWQEKISKSPIDR